MFAYAHPWKALGSQSFGLSFQTPVLLSKCLLAVDTLQHKSYWGSTEQALQESKQGLARWSSEKSMTDRAWSSDPTQSCKERTTTSSVAFSPQHGRPDRCTHSMRISCKEINKTMKKESKNTESMRWEQRENSCNLHYLRSWGRTKGVQSLLGYIGRSYKIYVCVHMYM